MGANINRVLSNDDKIKMWSRMNCIFFPIPPLTRYSCAIRHSTINVAVALHADLFSIRRSSNVLLKKYKFGECHHRVRCRFVVYFFSLLLLRPHHWFFNLWTDEKAYRLDYNLFRKSFCFSLLPPSIYILFIPFHRIDDIYTGNFLFSFTSCFFSNSRKKKVEESGFISRFHEVEILFLPIFLILQSICTQRVVPINRNAKFPNSWQINNIETKSAQIYTFFLSLLLGI